MINNFDLPSSTELDTKGFQLTRGVLLSSIQQQIHNYIGYASDPWYLHAIV